MSLADSENSDPEEPDANCRDADDRTAEKQQDDQCEQNVVYRKDLCRAYKDPVDRIEDIDMSQDVSTIMLADRVFGLVYCSEEHRYPNKDRDEKQQNSAQKLEWSKYRLGFEPCPDQPAASFALCLLNQTLPPDKCSFFSHQAI